MKLYNKKQLEIISIASPDETRGGLQGLYFDGNTTVAGDDHRIICVENTKQSSTADWPANGIKWNNQDTPFIVTKNTIQKAMKNIPKKPDLPILKNVAIGLKDRPDMTPQKVVCQTTDMENTDNVEAQTLDSKYPTYKRVIPDYEDSATYQRVGISARYLVEVCGLLGKYQENSKIITLYVKKDVMRNGEINVPGENFPIVVTADDEEGTKATAVIMPMRL